MLRNQRWAAILTSLNLFACVGLLILTAALPVRASVESDISRLESDISQLRQEVSRLGSEVRQLSASGDRPAIGENSPSSAPEIDSPLASDPMFDRLATLVIELKRRVERLERCLPLASEECKD
jgi:outer membrane murein-binding lipoprotein Lpp